MKFDATPASQATAGTSDAGRLELLGWSSMYDTECLDALRPREDLLWLCQGGSDGDHGVLVRGWRAVVRHYATHAINCVEPDEHLDEAEANLLVHPEQWAFGANGTASRYFSFEDGFLSFTLVTDAAFLAPAGGTASGVPPGCALVPIEPTQRIYLDLDGVMADFDAHFPATFGLDHRSLADDAMWEQINAHPSYFRDMPPCPGAVEFFREIEHLRPIILTACPRTNYAHAALQKREWVREHLSRHVTVLPVMGGHNKPLFMQELGDMLIDDFEKNTIAWSKAGGSPILHRDFDTTRLSLAGFMTMGGAPGFVPPPVAAVPPPGPPPSGDAVETFATIAQWCEETFGPISPARIVSRAAEEMDELRAEPTRVEEAADVVIVLSRYPGLWDAVQRKMAVNRGRTWRLMGDGTGYHVKGDGTGPGPSATTPAAGAGLAGVEAALNALIAAADMAGYHSGRDASTEQDVTDAKRVQTQARTAVLEAVRALLKPPADVTEPLEAWGRARHQEGVQWLNGDPETAKIAADAASRELDAAIAALAGGAHGGSAGVGVRAWAVATISDDRIQIATVSQHRRAAMVNWLVAECGVLVTQAWDDQAIRRAWEKRRAGRARLVEVQVSEFDRTRIEAALARVGQDEDGWRPICEARKDCTAYLLKLKNPIPGPPRDDLRRWDGLAFVGWHPGLADDGFDIGWQFAAPIGQGGFPDGWFEGFRELPAQPSGDAS